MSMKESVIFVFILFVGISSAATWATLSTYTSQGCGGNPSQVIYMKADGSCIPLTKTNSQRLTCYANGTVYQEMCDTSGTCDCATPKRTLYTQCLSTVQYGCVNDLTAASTQYTISFSYDTSCDNYFYFVATPSISCSVIPEHCVAVSNFNRTAYSHTGCLPSSSSSSSPSSSTSTSSTSSSSSLSSTSATSTNSSSSLFSSSSFPSSASVVAIGSVLSLGLLLIIA